MASRESLMSAEESSKSEPSPSSPSTPSTVRARGSATSPKPKPSSTTSTSTSSSYEVRGSKELGGGESSDRPSRIGHPPRLLSVELGRPCNLCIDPRPVVYVTSPPSTSLDLVCWTMRRSTMGTGTVPSVISVYRYQKRTLQPSADWLDSVRRTGMPC